jgi:hypothetical protein
MLCVWKSLPAGVPQQAGGGQHCSVAGDGWDTPKKYPLLPIWQPAGTTEPPTRAPAPACGGDAPLRAPAARCLVAGNCDFWGQRDLPPVARSVANSGRHVCRRRPVTIEPESSYTIRETRGARRGCVSGSTAKDRSLPGVKSVLPTYGKSPQRALIGGGRGEHPSHTIFTAQPPPPVSSFWPGRVKMIPGAVDCCG